MKKVLTLALSVLALAMFMGCPTTTDGPGESKETPEGTWEIAMAPSKAIFDGSYSKYDYIFNKGGSFKVDAVHMVV